MATGRHLPDSNAQEGEKKMKKIMVVVGLAVGMLAARAGTLDHPRLVFECFPNVNVDAHIYKIAQKYFPEVGSPMSSNELAEARVIPRLDWNEAKPTDMAKHLRRTLRAWAMGGKPWKAWRAFNQQDCFRWCSFRTDPFWSSLHVGESRGGLNPLISILMHVEEDAAWHYMEGWEEREDGSVDYNRRIYSWRIPENAEEILREMCAADECARDVIVGIGLVNKDLPTVKKVVMELAEQSEINLPVYALRVEASEADRLLANKEEFAQLRSNLAIKHMAPGMERYRAICEHMAKFPDYREEDMEKTSVALNTFEELNAVAGYELMMAGDYRGAFKRWMDGGGFAEDVALVAEQLLTEEELKGFCAQYAPELDKDYKWMQYSKPFACDCAHGSTWEHGFEICSPYILRRYIRDVLAKRLMRAGKSKEAVGWFQDSVDHLLAERYCQLDAMAKECREETENAAKRRAVLLTMGAFMRQNADRLFGTELEPDNMICRGMFDCKWATNDAPFRAARKIPESHRFHYRWRTAAIYEEIMKCCIGEDLDAMWSFAWWVKANILRYSDPKRAYAGIYDAKLVTKDVTRVSVASNGVARAIIKDEGKLPEQYTEWLARDIWLDEQKALPTTPPEPKVCELPMHENTPDALYRLGEELFAGAQACVNPDDKFGEYERATYAFYLAGKLGLAKGYARCASFHIIQLGDFITAEPYIKAAMELDAKCPVARYYYAMFKLHTGQAHEAVKTFEELRACGEGDIEEFSRRIIDKLEEYGGFGMPKKKVP